ncbi:MAG: class I SAM-dependent methyltransferase [Micromonosporaceae bacterium]
MTAAYPDLVVVSAGSGPASGTRGPVAEVPHPAVPLQVYEAALHRASGGAPAALRFVTDCGVTRTVDVARWCADAVPGDAGILDRCGGPTLDVGCGPGRLAAALLRRGVLALGVDISEAAVRLAQLRGALAVRRDVFGQLPGERRWEHLVLADGNIGIGGDPVRLLRRCRALLAGYGTVLVETEPAGTAASRPVRLRLCDSDRSSEPFDWAFVAADAVPGYAAMAGLRVTESWTEAGRWFSVLVVA